MVDIIHLDLINYNRDTFIDLFRVINSCFLFCRGVSNTVFHSLANMRGASFPPGGVCGSISRRWRNERGWTTLSNPQGSWIFRNRHGLLGKRLLHHHRCLDIVLHI